MADEQTAWASLVTMQLATLTRMSEQLWEAVAEIRDLHIELDHRIATVRREGRATREVLTAMQEDAA